MPRLTASAVIDAREQLDVGLDERVLDRAWQRHEESTWDRSWTGSTLSDATGHVAFLERRRE